MKHIMNISVSEKSHSKGTIQLRKIAVGKRIMNKLFGASGQIVVLVPGNTVQTVSITEVPGVAEEDAHKPINCNVCRERSRYEAVRS